MTIEKLETECKFEIFENGKSMPPEIAAMAEEGELLIKSESLTPKFLPEPWLTALAKDSINQRLLYRHKDPENPEVRGIPYGRVLSAEVNKDGNIESWYRIFSKLSDDDPHEKLQSWVKTRKQRGQKVGISKGYIVNKDEKNGNILRVFSLEDSITYKPKVKQALVQEVFQMESEEKVKEQLDKEMTELTSQLDEAKLQLEENDKIVTDLKVKLEQYEETMENSKTEKQTLEDKVVELSDTLNEFTNKFEEYKLSTARKPYLDKLKELEDNEIFDIIQDRDVEWLEERLEKKLKEASGPRVKTTTLDKERQESEEEEPQDIGQKAFRNNPKLQAQVAKYEKLLKERGAI